MKRERRKISVKGGRDLPHGTHAQGPLSFHNQSNDKRESVWKIEEVFKGFVKRSAPNTP